MDKKKKIILGTTSAGILLIAGSTMALFHDSIETVINQKVGTVDVNADVSMKHTQFKRDKLAEALSIKDDSTPTILKLLAASNYFEGLAKSESAPTFNPDFDAVETLMEAGPDNLNPGDNTILSLESDDIADRKPGTDHEIEISVKNEGTKSVQTRILVYATGTKADGTQLSSEDLIDNFTVSIDWLNSKSGLTSIPLFNALLYNLSAEATTVDGKPAACYSLDSSNCADVLTIMNAIPDDDPLYGDILAKVKDNISDYVKSGLILSGNSELDNSEKEKYTKNTITLKELESDSMLEPIGALISLPDTFFEHESTQTIVDVPDTGNIKLDVGMTDYSGQTERIGISRDTDQTLQGASINFTVVVQGMQYRNTNSSNWEDISSQNFTLNVE